MFNIAFPEFIVIGVIALIVIGPDKLPKLAQTAGVLMGRMQRYMSSIKSDIDNELKNQDLQKLHDELKQHNSGLNDELRRGMQPVENVIRRPPQSDQTDQTDQTDSHDESITTNPHVTEPSTGKPVD